MKTILFLFGGCSTEYEVSLQSAHAVLQALDRSRYTPLAVGITREGRWLRYGGPLFHLETGDWEAQPTCGSCGWMGPAGANPSTRHFPSSTAKTARTAPSRACWS